MPIGASHTSVLECDFLYLASDPMPILCHTIGCAKSAFPVKLLTVLTITVDVEIKKGSPITAIALGVFLDPSVIGLSLMSFLPALLESRCFWINTLLRVPMPFSSDTIWDRYVPRIAGAVLDATLLSTWNLSLHPSLFGGVKPSKLEIACQAMIQ
jgi:hypothetical protein